MSEALGANPQVGLSVVINDGDGGLMGDAESLIKLENADFESLYAALNVKREMAAKELVRKRLDDLIAAAQKARNTIVSTLGQPGITSALDAHMIALDPSLAFTQPTPELDQAMAEILAKIRGNRVLNEDEKQLLVEKLNQNNGPGSNYEL